MRDRFPLLVIASLVMLAVLASFLVKGAARGSFADTLSTYRSEPDGARALYLLSEARGIPVGRLQTDFQALDEKQNLLLFAVEFSEKSDDEAEPTSFFGALPDGGMPDKDKDDQPDEDRLHKGTNNFRARMVGVKEREKLLEHVRGGATLVYLPWGHDENPMLKALDVHLWKAEKSLESRTLVPSQPTAWTRGVESVETHVQSYLDLPPGSTPLLLDEKLNEYVAGLVPYGQGQVVVIGAPELAMNKSLRLADNAQLWSSVIAAAARTGPVEFDEFHHGFTNDRSIADFARRYGLQFAALQIILGVCLWAGSLRRFGRPKQPPEDIRVGSTDALFATSRLYREGKHFGHAAMAIVRQLTTELAPIAGLPAKAEAKEVADALRARARPELGQALIETWYRAKAAASDADVVTVASHAALARSLAHKKKSLPPPTGPSHAA